MKLQKESTQKVSFPLGGIGSGCIGFTGNGHLKDWEIFNKSAKGSFNGISHFAVRAESGGKVIDFRLCHGDEVSSFEGVYAPGDDRQFRGYGWGPVNELLCGWPHFKNHTFIGEFPFAKILFEDSHFPGKVNMEAWSPFIPGNSQDSSMPTACFEIEIKNTTHEALNYTCIGVLSNPWSNQESFNSLTKKQLTVNSGLPEEDLTHGDITLSLNSDTAVSGQEYFMRGGWIDHMEAYYNDVMNGGLFKNRKYNDSPKKKFDHGLLASHFTLQPGEIKRVSFSLTWNIPLRKNDWHWNAEKICADNNIKNVWKNYYATQWADSKTSAKYLAKNYKRFYAETKKFHDALFFGNIPENIKESISTNLAVLRSPTCLRLEDGTFWGWEGVGSFWGSCEGSCTHVWNYAQALPFLFPDLERSMRESHFKYSVDEFGGAHFRLQLPLGIRATKDSFRPCADGQFGDIMKFYRDWKIFGDNTWLKQWYPTLKAMMEYAWSKNNPDKWDLKKTGVLHGRQHHTLDMELFGANSWLTGHYLGALSAMSEMASIMGDNEFSKECDVIKEKGQCFVDKNLFNGEYYCQNINLKNKKLVKSFGAINYWNDETKEIKYQIANGCGIDATLAQCYASLYGLPQIFDKKQNRKTLKAIYKNNFHKSVRNVFNPWRIYSLNDEGGVQICTWPNNNRPKIPIPYHTETMHGFEWTFAVHLLIEGFFNEAQEVVKSIRDRYDGEKRNPWNELECGSNYARSMASYGLLLAWSGFQFDLTSGMIGFTPNKNVKELNCFWSVGTAWGVVSESQKTIKFVLDYGKLKLNTFRLNKQIKEIQLDGKKQKFVQTGTIIKFDDYLSLDTSSRLIFVS